MEARGHQEAWGDKYHRYIDDRHPQKFSSVLENFYSYQLRIVTQYLVLTACGCQFRNSWKTAPEDGPEPTRANINIPLASTTTLLKTYIITLYLITDY